MLRYEKLNENFNRIWHRNKYRHLRSSNSVNTLDVKNATDITGEKSGTFDKFTKDNDEKNLAVQPRSTDESLGERGAENADRDRYEKAVVAFERRNRDVTTIAPIPRDDLDGDTITTSGSRTGRSRRDDGRGKKRRKIKRRLKRSRQRLGILSFFF